MKRWRRILVAAIVVVVGGAGTTVVMRRAAPPTFYVAVDGSDTASGTSSAPWLTIGYGASQLKAGATLVVRSGVYLEGDIDLSASGTAKRPIRIKAAKPGTVLLSGTGNGMVFEARDHVAVRGLTFRDYEQAVRFNGGTGHAVRRCTFISCGGPTYGCGIWAHHTSDLIVGQCEFLDTVTQDEPDPTVMDYGVALYAVAGSLITNCEFVGRFGQAVSFKDGCSDGTVSGCTFTGMPNTAIFLGQDHGAATYAYCRDLSARNNTIQSGEHWDLRLGVRIEKCEGAVVCNNHIRGATTAGIVVTTASHGHAPRGIIKLGGNTLTACRTGIYLDTAEAAIHLTANIFDDNGLDVFVSEWTETVGGD